MLLLLQVAAQQIPIHVTVQQPPGLPVWVTALISAGVGATFGIMSNVAMEFIKPAIARKIEKRKVKRELVVELYENWKLWDHMVKDTDEALVKAIGVSLFDRSTRLEHLVIDAVISLAELLVKETDDERYEYYRKDRKTLVFDIDRTGLIRNFYGNAKEIIPQELTELKTSRKAYLAGSIANKFFVNKQLGQLVFPHGDPKRLHAGNIVDSILRRPRL